MKQILYVLTILSLLTSCATVFNHPYKYITVYTTQPSKIIFRKDTIQTNRNNKAGLIVERKRAPINIVASSDSITKSIEVKPENSIMYWANICYNYGLGMLIDRNSPKRYTYPSKIYINSADTIEKYYRYAQSRKKGELDLHLSIPYVNSFLLSPDNEGTKINTGFWGITAGLDYYHSKNQFVNISVSGILDYFLPFPAAVDLIGEWEFMSSKYFSLSNNQRYKRFSFGYGLSYSRNTWDFRYYDMWDPLPQTRESVKKSHLAFGLIFPNYFQIGKYFNIGVVYRPTFYRPDLRDKFKYEHLISIDFAWKIRLK